MSTIKNVNIKTANLFGITFLVAERPDMRIIHVLAADSLTPVDDFSGNGTTFDPKGFIGVEVLKDGTFAYLANINQTTGQKRYFQYEGQEGKNWQEFQTACPAHIRATITAPSLSSNGATGIVLDIDEEGGKIRFAKDSELSSNPQTEGRWYKTSNLHLKATMAPGFICRIPSIRDGVFFKMVGNGDDNSTIEVVDNTGNSQQVNRQDVFRVTERYSHRFAQYGFDSEEAFKEAYAEISAQ